MDVYDPKPFGSETEEELLDDQHSDTLTACPGRVCNATVNSSKADLVGCQFGEPLA
jgi:hypothetical protein